MGRKLGTQAGVHFIEGVRLIWGPFNTGFTVLALISIGLNLGIRSVCRLAPNYETLV